MWSEVGTNTELFSNWKKIADPENRVKSVGQLEGYYIQT